MEPATLVSNLLLAQSEPNSTSVYVFEACGPIYAVGIILLGVATFGGALLLTIRFRRPDIVSAYLLLTSIPLLFGFLGTLHRLFQVFFSVRYAPTDVDLEGLLFLGVADSSVAMLLGLLASIPGFLTAAIGIFVRKLLVEVKHLDTADDDDQEEEESSYYGY